jgi:FMN phosphatase YigB (HAD superfamily)
VKLPELEGVRLVSWDVDGTLYSRRALERRLLWAALRGWKGWQQLRALRGYHRAIEAQRRTPEARVNAEALEKFGLRGDVVLRMLEGLAPNPVAVELIAALSGLKIPQVVLSDFAAQEKLKALGLQDRLPLAYDCQRLGHWKPSPIPFAHLEQVHGVRAADHLHIGDRLDTDGEGARRAGCRFLHLVG